MEEQDNNSEIIKKYLANMADMLKAIHEHITVDKPQPQQIERTMPKDLFTMVYNDAKYKIPIQTPLMTLGIWFDNKFKNSMVNNYLYPADCLEGFYFPTGEISPIPIGFKELRGDYCIDFVLEGEIM